MAGDFGLGLNLAMTALDYYRNCMCSIPGGEPESLENDDQFGSRGCVLRALNRARAFPLLLLDSDSFNCIYSFTKRIKIFLIYDTIASTNL